jgi:hypothetical protein
MWNAADLKSAAMAELALRNDHGRVRCTYLLLSNLRSLPVAG